MPIAVHPLRWALAALHAAQPGLPEPASAVVRRATALRLTDAERADELAIDDLRRRLASSRATVEVVDYGAGTKGGQRPPMRRISDIVARAATGPAWGRFLYALARAQQPRRVLELGTNLGISAAYLGLAMRRTEQEGGVSGHLVTLEGAPSLADLSHRHLDELAISDRVEVITGRFVDTLPNVLDAHGPFDLVFIDGHHEEDAAFSYANSIRPHLTPSALVILDDVEPGRPVRRAWQRLREAHPEDGALWLGKLGLLSVGSAPQTSPRPDTGHGLGRTPASVASSPR
ncbi:MAG: class I SAM-dependent methyltransferase [Bacteroidota bacterium]